MSCLNSFALTSLLDANSNYFQPGLPVYYRTQNFDEASVGEAISEMGFQTSPSAYDASGGYSVSGEWQTGTADVMVCPQPGVDSLTLKMISDAVKAGTALRVGAKRFSISHSWVASIQTQMLYANPRSVFNDPHVVGFYHDGLLYSIVSFTHNDMWGAIINWDVLCNANDIK